MSPGFNPDEPVSTPLDFGSKGGSGLKDASYRGRAGHVDHRLTQN